MSKHSGFTLIEVSLAIVIGVTVLAGAVALYNQVKLSAGNARAQAKTLRAADLIETMAAQGGGVYPTLEQLRAKWIALGPEDALTSPWGGTAGMPGEWTQDPSVRGIIEVYLWPANPWTKDYLTDRSAQGLLAYGLNTPGATQSVTDAYTKRTKVYSRYVIGLYDSKGTSPWFPVGQ